MAPRIQANRQEESRFLTKNYNFPYIHDEMENLFSFLYSFIPLIGMCGYLPQIYRLMYQNAPTDSISLTTWGLWFGTWTISLGYGVVCLNDVLFSMTCSMNLIGHAAIIVLVLYKRGKFAVAASPARA